MSLKTPPWMNSEDEIIAEVKKFISTMSLGVQSRIPVDLSGFAPILLDRWEFDAFTGRSAESAMVRQAVANRSLCRELLLAFQDREQLDLNLIDELNTRFAGSIRRADEVVVAITKAVGTEDSAHGRHLHLTRDNLNREVDALADALTEAEIEVRRLKVDSAGDVSSGAYDRGSISGAFKQAGKDFFAASRGQIAILLVIVVAAVSVATYHLYPRDNRVMVDKNEFSQWVKLQEAWMKGTVLVGVVDNSWYQHDDEEKLRRLREIYEFATSGFDATQVCLYQPSGVAVAAVINEERELLQPRYQN